MKLVKIAAKGGEAAGKTLQYGDYRKSVVTTLGCIGRMLAQAGGPGKKMKLTISLGQMDVILGQPMKNLEQVAAMTAEAARRGSDVVVFPELW